MKEYADNYLEFEQAPDKEPRFVVQVSWDTADTDYTYFTSTSDANLPIASPAVDSIDGVVTGISGQTQKINPDVATSTIGSVTVSLQDNVAKDISAKIATKLEGGDGLRKKIVRVYVGYEDMPFSDYDLRLTYIVDGVTLSGGVYKINLSDIQREARKKIFTPDETNLDASISSTDMIIPVTTSDTALFQLIVHGSEWSVRPGEEVGYIKIGDEVICHTGISFDTTNGWHITAIERHALNTRAAEHTLGSDVDLADSKKPKIVEHVYLEGPAPKVMYALLTGVLLNGASPEDALPDHWNLGIDTAFVRLSEFQLLGDDYWDTSNDSGRPTRIENPGTQDGKRYIEKEMLLWMGAFMPVYSDGALGIKRLRGILSDSSYDVYLNEAHVKSHSDLGHDMRSVINNIRVLWNWVDSKEAYTKESLLLDSTSIGIHGTADEKVFKFKTVRTGVHTDESVLAYFDTLRDRYSGPPLLIKLDLLPSMMNIEVGDVVYVDLDTIWDMNTGAQLKRSFEVQQVSSNWITGEASVVLFGSSMKAGELSRTTLGNELNDSFYTALGTNLTSVLTIVGGVVTVSGTLTGHATDIDNASSIFYYDGDLEIQAGKTVTLVNNVQLRIKGTLTINGDIDGTAGGPSGGAGVTLYKNGTATTNTGYPTYAAPSALDLNLGDVGYFGYTASAVPPLWKYSTKYVQYIGNIVTSFVSVNPYQLYTRYGNTGGALKVPFFGLNNDTENDTLTGYRRAGATYPGDFRGMSGSGGLPLIKRAENATGAITHTIEATGGAGGKGGAGLLIISRGVAFGGSGFIDLSGGDSTAGLSSTAAGNTHYGASGAPGAPGAWLLFLDGAVTNPDIDDTIFIANYGDAPTGVGDTDYGATGAYAATENFMSWQSAYIIQYIPNDETPAIEDDAEFVTIVPGKYNEFNNVYKDLTKTASDAFGRSVAITDDGTRLVGSGGVSPGARYLQVFRNTTNPIVEATIADPSTAGNVFGWGKIIISDDGDRIAVTNMDDTVSGNTLAGSVWVYSRTGLTWAIERLFQDPTPAVNERFGRQITMDGAGEHLIISQDDGSNIAKLRYYTRSGTVWTDQGLITAGTTSSTWANNFEISEDTNWLIVNGLFNQIYLYERSGTTWTASSGNPFEVGTASQSYGTGTPIINEDGTAIVVSGKTTDSPAITAVRVLYLEGITPILIQEIEAPSGLSTAALGASDQKMSMSKDGMILILADTDSNTEEVYIYRRTNLKQKFVLDQTIIKLDNDSISSTVWIKLSKSGDYFLYGSPGEDSTGVTNHGVINTWLLARKSEVYT